MKVVCLGSQQVYAGRIVRLEVDRVRLPDGRETQWEVVRHPRAVVVVPVLPDGRIVGVMQFRYAVGQELWELPAGIVKEGQEEPHDCAHRELREETGYRAHRLTFLGEFFTSPGFTDERMFAFLAEELEPVGQSLEHDEFLRVMPLSWEEIQQRATTVKLRDGKTLAALYLYALYRLHSG